MTLSNRMSPPRRIALLAHGLWMGGGMHNGKNLLAAIMREGPQHSYLVTVPFGVGYEELCRQHANCQTLVRRQDKGLAALWWFERVRAVRKMRDFRPDVILGLGISWLRYSACPQAMIYRNALRLYPRKHTGTISFPARLRYRLSDLYFRRGLSMCDLVFCQTELSRKQLAEVAGYRGPIRLCPNAVYSPPTCDYSTDRPSCFSGHEGKFILFCLSADYPHKNLDSIVDMFSLYREQLRDCVVFLTLSPKHGPRTRRLLARIAREDLRDNIVNIGPIPQQELSRYYRHSNAMILPTLVESFSTTYIEAMRFDCPVLTSDLDFAHEICGDAAIYFDPWSPGSIKDAILTLKGNPDLAGQLVESGRSRIREIGISWEEIARGVLRTLEGLVTHERPLAA